MMDEIRLYHFFAWSDYHGWQHLGMTDGYCSAEECKKDMEFYIYGDKGFSHAKRDKWRIMKLELYQKGKQ